MTVKSFLPLALVSALALAACEERAAPPDVPNPDAGNPEAFAEPVEDDAETTEAPMSPQEMQQRRQEIEQDAQQTFESIMEDTQRAGDDLMQMGDEAMDALSQSVTSAASAVETQIDTLVENAAQLRDDNLTEAEKLEIVSNVRDAAEEAARALGQSESQIVSAGDVAEERTRQVLGVE